MVAENKKIRFELLGPFRVVSDDGRDLTPRGRKSCALLALLAFSDQHQRSRKWIQDKLWSDRGEEQGSASLRQCLVEIRKCFGTNRDVLFSNRIFVGLDIEQIEIPDLNTLAYQPGKDQPLLEGLDIRDQEFEDWLRLIRGKFNQLLEANVLEYNRDASPPNLTACPPSIILAHSERDLGPLTQGISKQLAASIGQLIAESGSVNVFDSASNQSELASETSGSVSIKFDTIEMADAFMVNLSLRDQKTGGLIWADTTSINIQDTTEKMLPDILKVANCVANITMNGFDVHSEHAYRKRAIKLLYRHGSQNYLQADALFAKAFDVSQRGVYIAWRAYVRSFFIAEKLPCCVQTICEEANEFSMKAMELEPYNSLVLALCAHVKSIIELNHIAAFELAHRSLEICSANPLAWVTLGMSESHMGRPENGYRHCKIALQISSFSPFRHHIELLACIIGVMAGKVDEAKYYGESANSFTPSLAAPLRFLTAIYSGEKNERKVEEKVSMLRKIEPAFELGYLKDEDYPVESLRRSDLMSKVRSFIG